MVRFCHAIWHGNFSHAVVYDILLWMPSHSSSERVEFLRSRGNGVFLVCRFYWNLTPSWPSWRNCTRNRKLLDQYGWPWSDVSAFRFSLWFGSCCAFVTYTLANAYASICPARNINACSLLLQCCLGVPTNNRSTEACWHYEVHMRPVPQTFHSLLHQQTWSQSRASGRVLKFQRCWRRISDV